MAKVFLDLVPPSDIPDVVALRIYEAPAVDGPFSEIERVTEVGVAPNYISAYTTDLATDENNWFAIRWETAAGVLTPYSDAVQGGTTTVVADVVSRVMLRDPTLSEEIVFQEAQAIIEDMYGSTVPSPDVIKKSTLNGIALLTMARAQLVSYAASMSRAGLSWTAGLVSMKSGAGGTTLDQVKALMAEASRILGLNTSIVAQMVLPEINYGLSEIVTADISRLLIEVE